LFAAIVARPTIDAAIRLEAAHSAAEHSSAGEAELFSRNTQLVGLIVGILLLGLALGAVFALVYGGLARRNGADRNEFGRNEAGNEPDDAWRRSLGLGLAVFVGLYLVPALRYPPEPPGVGDPATVNQRTVLYLSAVVIGLAVVCGYAWLRARLRRSGDWTPAQQTVVLVAAMALTWAACWALPDVARVGGVPDTLLWDFRIRSLATQGLLIATIAAVFGLLITRAPRRQA
jgi:hypothetical protein